MHPHRFSIRKLPRSFGLIAGVLLTVFLCLAAGLLISVVVNSVLMRQFPFPTPDQLESMFDTQPKSIVDLIFAIRDLMDAAR